MSFLSVLSVLIYPKVIHTLELSGLIRSGLIWHGTVWYGAVQFVTILGLGPKLAEKGSKWPKLTWMSEKCHPKLSPFDSCFSCGHFEWSHDQFTTILSMGPKLAKNGRKRLQMTKIGLNVWKVTSKTNSIGFLLLLRSFWVVTWPVYNNLEFKAKIGHKWPERASNDWNCPECVKNGICSHLHWISASLAVMLSGHMTSLWQFWIWGQKWLKKAPNDQKWPICL